MQHIGRPLRTIYVEPLQQPEPLRPATAPEPIREPETEPSPVHEPDKEPAR